MLAFCVKIPQTVLLVEDGEKVATHNVLAKNQDVAVRIIDSAVVGHHLGVVGNVAKVGQIVLASVVFARPDGAIVAVADPSAVTRSRAKTRLPADIVQVVDSVNDCSVRGGIPVAVAVLEAKKLVGRGGSVVESSDVVAGKVRVDLGQLDVDLLDGAGDVDRGSVGEGLDFPGDILNTVAWNGSLEAKDLWCCETLAPSFKRGWEVSHLTRVAQEASKRMAERSVVD